MMLKYSSWRFLLRLCGATIALLYAQFLFATIAQAVPLPSPQIAFDGTTTGRAGSHVRIVGSGFTPASTVSLYTTTSGDPAQCASGAAGLAPFATNPTASAGADGALTVESTWPDNAANPGTAYHVCAIAPDAAALTSNTFTVTGQPSIDTVSPQSVNPGEEVTITGSNWLPPQQLNVAIIGDGGQPLVQKNDVTSDNGGNFSTTLTIPANAQARAYSVRVYAVNDTNLNATQNNVLTVKQQAPTPTPEPSPTATPTPTETPTATTATPTPEPTSATSPNNPGSGSDGNPVVTTLIFGLGGLGVLLVIIGGVVFAVYARE